MMVVDEWIQNEPVSRKEDTQTNTMKQLLPWGKAAEIAIERGRYNQR